MKKIFTVLTLLSTMLVFSFAKTHDDREFIIKIGFQPQSKLSAWDTNSNTNIGMSVGVEYFQYFGNMFAFGAGSVYELPKKNLSDEHKGSVSFLPLYVGTKIRTPIHGIDDNYMFLSGRVGYSPLMAKDTDWKSSNGGLHYGIGLGINLSVLVIEAVYSENRFSYTINDQKDGSYSTITLYAGLKFE